MNRRAPGFGRRINRAFSLIEVMVALAIFFMAVFAILGLLSQLLKNSRAFQRKKGADAGMVHAYWSSITNRVTKDWRAASSVILPNSRTNIAIIPGKRTPCSTRPTDCGRWIIV